MDLRILNKLCFTISIICIVAGVVTALWMLWTPGISETAWRLLATVGIVFFGSSATLAVSTAFGKASVSRQSVEAEPAARPDVPSVDR